MLLTLSIPKKYKKSFTVYRSSEFHNHKQLSAHTAMKVIFCDPAYPWQRCTNENANGLLRQYFPKKTSFSELSQVDIDYAVNALNNRPRKRLGFKTPNEVFLK